MEQHQCTEHLARDVAEVARARGLVARTLRSWGTEVDVRDAVLIVSELVTNALRHGAGHVWMRLTANRRRLRIEVIDEGGTAITPFVRSDDGPGGWGLHLVDRLADRRGTDVNRSTRVWAETVSG